MISRDESRLLAREAVNRLAASWRAAPRSATAVRVLPDRGDIGRRVNGP
jgi:hypothetical protein